MNKIEAEINKIAKLLQAEDVASEDGKYKNFTGKIDYNGTKGQVKNATFELRKNGAIFWETGFWLNGVWDGDYWNNGVWKKGTWKKGIWEKGTWEDGKFLRGVWEDGDWNGGKFKGVWEGGNWFDKKNPEPKIR